MDILAPKTSAELRILVLGAVRSDEDELVRRFAEFGFCVDLAQSAEDALQSFLQHGGHDGVYVIGAETEDMRRTLHSLGEIDPQLALGHSAGLPGRDALDELASEVQARRRGA